MANYIDELTAAVSAGKQKGQSAADLQAALAPASFKSLADGGYGEFIVDSSLRYRPNPPGATRAEVLANAVKENIEHTYNTVDRS